MTEPSRGPEVEKPSSPPRNLKPHRGEMMAMLGVLSLIVAPLILAPITWLMARSDLKEMDEGRMDPAGRAQTATARLLAMISTITWPIVLSCCCTGMIGKQLVYGGRFISAMGSRPITQEEFKRIQFGMTEKDVKEVVGPPARTEIDDGRLYWHWHEKNGPAKFSIDFDSRGRVCGCGIHTPD